MVKQFDNPIRNKWMWKRIPNIFQPSVIKLNIKVSFLITVGRNAFIDIILQRYLWESQALCQNLSNKKYNPQNQQKHPVSLSSIFVSQYYHCLFYPDFIIIKRRYPCWLNLVCRRTFDPLSFIILLCGCSFYIRNSNRF